MSARMEQFNWRLNKKSRTSSTQIRRPSLPTISQRRLHSTVSVTNGQTVLLGGLISEQDQRTKAGIPILKDIAIIGDLFATQVSAKKRSKLLCLSNRSWSVTVSDARQVAEAEIDYKSCVVNRKNTAPSSAGLSASRSDDRS